MANVAWKYNNQGRWKEAEEIGAQVIEIRERVLGLEHAPTPTTMSDLASTYRKQGRWKPAEELEVQAMESRKKVLGPEHPDTLISMNNFAFILKDRGEDEKAAALMEECVGKRKRPFMKDTFSRWRMEGLHLGSLGKEVNTTAAGE